MECACPYRGTVLTVAFFNDARSIFVVVLERAIVLCTQGRVSGECGACVVETKGAQSERSTALRTEKEKERERVRMRVRDTLGL